MTSPWQGRVGSAPGGSRVPKASDLRPLVERSARGDERAFERVYRTVAAPVYGVALRTLRSPAHAEEVAQEVLLEMRRTAAVYRPERGSVMTWALTIAHHRAVDRVRCVRAAAERDHRVAARGPVPSDTPEEQVVRSLDRLRVRSALAELSSAQREAVVLAYYGGYSHREIAQRTRVPLGPVKTRIRDALIRLRAAFDVGSDLPCTRQARAGLRAWPGSNRLTGAGR
ncbi:sigma-70 family RNA polymerase sigma factor [Kitasatospora sp. NPDC059146]|uniref:sigma-70 family RNA polymerase sigma factor n=1 Tax=Kitasatospora sp. NPDC059146 TaxID=3346741 RepID=UPI003674765F